MDDKIQVKVPLGVMEYTEEELSKELMDFSFLKDAFLVMLNPEVTSKSDFPFDEETTLKYAREMYSETSYNQDLIEKCFSKRLQQCSKMKEHK